MLQVLQPGQLECVTGGGERLSRAWAGTKKWGARVGWGLLGAASAADGGMTGYDEYQQSGNMKKAVAKGTEQAVGDMILPLAVKYGTKWLGYARFGALGVIAAVMEPTPAQ